MTRINGNIPVIELTDQHLFTEHRELPRVATLYNKTVQKRPHKVPQDRPFSLGTGHVKFFLDKHTFCHDRAQSIFQELTIRGTHKKSPDYSVAWQNLIDSELFDQSDFQFDDQHNDIIRRRIGERLIDSRQFWTFYGKRVDRLQAIDLLQFDQQIHKEYLLESLDHFKIHFEKFYGRSKAVKEQFKSAKAEFAEYKKQLRLQYFHTTFVK